MNPLFSENNHQFTLDTVFQYAVDLAGLYKEFTHATEAAAPNLPIHIRDQLFVRIVDLYVADRYHAAIVQELSDITDKLSDIAESTDFIATQCGTDCPPMGCAIEYGKSLGITPDVGESAQHFWERIQQKTTEIKGRG